MNWLQIAGIGMISLLPILGWLWFFQKKQPEKRSYVVLTFLAGMLSVLPIKLYEKYWNTAVGYFEHLNLFKYLADLVEYPALSKLLAYISVHAGVAVSLFVFTAIIMFFLEVFSGDNTVKVYRQKVQKIWEAPVFFIMIGILCGIVAYCVSLSLPQKIWFFVVVGMLEEFIKHLVLRFSDDEKIQSVDDALEFAIIVALGFVFIENILYFEKIWNGSFAATSIFGFILLRSTVSVVAHIGFSAILGYFYGVARFAKEIYQEEVSQRKHFVLEKIQQVLHLKGATLFHEEKMMEGMLLAMGFHAVFNSLLEYDKMIFVIPFLIFMFLIVLNLFHRKNFHTREGHFFSLS